MPSWPWISSSHKLSREETCPGNLQETPTIAMGDTWLIFLTAELAIFIALVARHLWYLAGKKKSYLDIGPHFTYCQERHADCMNWLLVIGACLCVMHYSLNSLVYRISTVFRPLVLRQPRLIPVQGVEQKADWYVGTPGAHEPCFELLAPFLLPGWYMLELQIQSSSTAGNALIHISNSQNKPHQGLQAFLPYTNAKGTKRIIFIGLKCKNLKLYPVEGKKDPDLKFAVNDLRLVPLLPFHARELMLQRLKAKHPEFQGQSSKSIINRVCTVRELKRHYDRTFVRHLDHLHDYQEWIRQHEAQVGQGIVQQSLDPAEDRAPRAQARQGPSIAAVIIGGKEADQASLGLTLKSLGQQERPCEEVVLVCEDPGDWVKHLGSLAGPFLSAPRLLSRNPELTSLAGDFLLLLQPGDVLDPQALSQVARELTQRPKAEIVYSDHDHLDQQGRRCQPVFKPDWNPELLLSRNYISRMCLLRRDLVLQARADGLKPGLDEQYALLLACAALARQENIVHIPRILCHQGPSAARGAGQAKPGMVEPGIKQALEYFLARRGWQATIEPGPIPGSNRLKYLLPEPAPLVSILIPTKDQPALLRTCITSILDSTSYPEYELLILDNQSREPESRQLLQELQEHPRIRVLAWDRPFNYSAINNFGAQQARGEILALLNNDLEVISRQWLREMAGHACRPGIGCVGAKLLYPDRTIQHGGVILGLGGVAGHAHRHFWADQPGYTHRLLLTQNMSAVTGACLVIHRQVYQDLGGLDTRFAVAYNDVDLCLRVRQAGYQNLWTPYAQLYHYESKSRGRANTPEKRAQFESEQAMMKEVWGHILYRDPCYNPNLSLEFEDFSLRNCRELPKGS